MSPRFEAYLLIEEAMMLLDDSRDEFADKVRDDVLDALWASLSDEEHTALYERGDMR